jgi:tetratricopeptide (TPR) repeat protein
VRGASEFDYRPSDATFYRFQLAYFLYQDGEVAKADAALDAGLAIDPDHLAALELKAKVLVARGRLDEAATLYEQLLQRGPAADLHGELAKVYRALGRDGEAAQQVQLGLQLGRATLGVYPAERRHLAGFFAEFDPALALEAAVTDFDTRKDVGAYDTLAWAYYVNGRYDDAARYLPGALAHGSQDAPLLYHAGMIEKAVGNSDHAHALLGQALRLNPHFDLTQAPLAKAALAELEGRGR